MLIFLCIAQQFISRKQRQERHSHFCITAEALHALSSKQILTFVITDWKRNIFLSACFGLESSLG